MPKAIDVHDMHSGIHSLYEIKSKPQTVAKCFRRLVELDAISDYFEVEDLWNFINENTEEPFEYNVNVQMFGTRYWKNKKLQNTGVVVVFDDVTYKIVESVRLY